MTLMKKHLKIIIKESDLTDLPDGVYAVKYSVNLNDKNLFLPFFQDIAYSQGDVAQMVERSLSMREAPGSIPGLSTLRPSRGRPL